MTTTPAKNSWRIINNALPVHPKHPHETPASHCSKWDFFFQMHPLLSPDASPNKPRAACSTERSNRYVAALVHCRCKGRLFQSIRGSKVLWNRISLTTILFRLIRSSWICTYIHTANLMKQQTQRQESKQLLSICSVSTTIISISISHLNSKRPFILLLISFYLVKKECFTCSDFWYRPIHAADDVRHRLSDGNQQRQHCAKQRKMIYINIYIAGSIL